LRPPEKYWRVLREEVEDIIWDVINQDEEVVRRTHAEVELRAWRAWSDRVLLESQREKAAKREARKNQKAG
jgi:hypothetical protein